MARGGASARVQELERQLAEAQATIASLREERAGGPDPGFDVTATGLVRSADARATAWCAEVGEVTPRHIADLFVESDAERVAALAETGWTGVVEHRFTTNAGRSVSLNVGPLSDADAAWRVTVRDLTARRVLDELQDERRRLEAVSRLAGAIARELNDPMSVVQGRVELLLALGDVPAEAREKHLRTALEHARRVSATLRNLRLVGATPAPTIEPVSLSEAAAAGIDLAGTRLRGVALDVVVEPPDLAAGGEAGLLARAIGNGLGYLLDTTPRGTPLELRARRRGDDVHVHLSGGAALDELLKQPLEVGPDAFGDSLGLSVAHTIASSLGGSIERRRLGSAAVVCLRLPRAPGKRVRRRAAEERVLFVGSPSQAAAIRGLLGPDGFEITSCADGASAMALLDGGFEADALVAEVLLTGMSGLTLAQEAARRHPRLRGRCVLISRADTAALPDDLVLVRAPLRRMPLLEALGRRVGRRR